jgi:hypothetical protein
VREATEIREYRDHGRGQGLISTPLELSLQKFFDLSHFALANNFRPQ